MMTIFSSPVSIARIPIPIKMTLTPRQTGSVLNGNYAASKCPGIKRNYQLLAPKGRIPVKDFTNWRGSGGLGVINGFRHTPTQTGVFLDSNSFASSSSTETNVDQILGELDIASPPHFSVPMYIDCRRIKATSFREFNLHPLGRTITSEDNLSDSSLASEAYSAHVMGHVFEKSGSKSRILFTEKSIRYKYPGCKKTDYVMELETSIDGLSIIAVEVKRISDFGGKVDLTDYYIHNLLSKANKGALESNKMVHFSNRWHTQVLHVITNIPGSVDVIRDWCGQVTDAGFSWVFVTVVLGNHNVVMNKI